MPLLRRLLPLAAFAALGCTPERAILPAPPAPPHLPAMPRTLAVPDVSHIPDELPPPATPPTGDYLHLSAEQCRQAACQHAPGADAVINAARDDDRAYVCDSGSRAETGRMRRVLARRLSQEVRNRSCGAALDLYYQLLEAELLTELLTAATAELDGLVRTAEGFRDRGFADGAELAKLRKQQTDTRTELLRVRHGARRLNGELKVLIGLAGPAGTLLPTDRVTVVRDRLDPDAAVRHGLVSRPDLVGLRELDANLGPKTVEAVRHAVLALNPATLPVTAAAYKVPLGVAHFLPRLLTGDIVAYRELLHGAIARREADADKEIRAAVDEWTVQQDLVAVAKRQASAERQRLAELTGRRAGGASVEAEYHTARLAALQADAGLIREAIKWKRADVSARLAMGVLCGPDDVPRCE